MNFFVPLLCEVLGTKVALERLDVFMNEKVVFEAAFSREPLTTPFKLAEQ